MTNQIYVIEPYREGVWKFTDRAVGLVGEPFVGSTNEMIDFLVRDIPNAKSGFRLLFSGDPFFNYQQKARRLRDDGARRKGRPFFRGCAPKDSIATAGPEPSS